MAKMLCLSFLISFFFSSIVRAIPASVTPTLFGGSLASTGISPKPTAPPDDSILFDPENELRKRQQYGDLCGYISGSSEWPVTCALGLQCAVNYYQRAMGCCPSGNLQYCQLATLCVEYASLGSCGSNCMADPGIGKCNAQYRYCGTFRSLYGTTTIEGYQCNLSPSIIVTVKATIDGAKGTTVTSIKPKTITATSIPSNSITAAPIIYNQNYYDNSTANKTETHTESKGGGGLSKGELAGIIIGTVTGVATIIGVIITLKRKLG